MNFLKKSLIVLENVLYNYIYTIVLPLLPFFYDWFISGKVTDNTLILTGCIYPISITAGRKNKLLLAVALVMCSIFSFMYGAFLLEPVRIVDWIRQFTYITIFVNIVFHMVAKVIEEVKLVK